MDKYDLEKVESDSPLRCQSVTKLGQCTNKVKEGFNLCPVHISAHNETIDNKTNRIYNITRWRDRIHRHADHSNITSLKEEIGILRLLLENLLDICHEPTDLILHTNQISELTIKVQRLVQDCHKLEKSTGKYLDKSAAIKVAGDIVEIIASHITDTLLLEKISNEIIEKVLNALPEEEVT